MLLSFTLRNCFYNTILNVQTPANIYISIFRQKLTVQKNRQKDWKGSSKVGQDPKAGERIHTTNEGPEK
jgi:hypothetical protein